jgi:hypothetical protein
MDERRPAALTSGRAIYCALVILGAAHCASIASPDVPIPTVDCRQVTCPTSIACNDLAAAALNRGEPDAARCLSAYALSLNPNDSEAHLGRGIANVVIGETIAARSDLGSVIAPGATANQTQITTAREWLYASTQPLPVLIAYTPAPECTPDADAFTGRALATVFDRMKNLHPIQHQPALWEASVFDAARAGKAAQIVHVALQCISIEQVQHPEQSILNGAMYRTEVRLVVEIYDVRSRRRTAEFHGQDTATHQVRYLSVTTAMARAVARLMYRLTERLLEGE